MPLSLLGSHRLRSLRVRGTVDTHTFTGVGDKYPIGYGFPCREVTPIQYLRRPGPDNHDCGVDGGVAMFSVSSGT